MIKKTINNEALEEAYKNLDYIKIMARAARQCNAKEVLSIEEIESCKLTGLLKSLEGWTQESGIKFTTYLYKRVQWECFYEADKVNKYYKKHKPFDESGQKTLKWSIQEFMKSEGREEVKDVIELLSEQSLKLIRQRFYENMTFNEIGEANGYTYETARKNVRKILINIRSLYL